MTVRPAKTQISLGIRSVRSESLLCAQWVAKDMRTANTLIRQGGCPADLSLRWAHTQFVGFVMSRLTNIIDKLLVDFLPQNINFFLSSVIYLCLPEILQYLSSFAAEASDTPMAKWLPVWKNYQRCSSEKIVTSVRQKKACVWKNWSDQRL